jgi:hypothetical protein
MVTISVVGLLLTGLNTVALIAFGIYVQKTVLRRDWAEYNRRVYLSEGLYPMAEYLYQLKFVVLEARISKVKSIKLPDKPLHAASRLALLLGAEIYGSLALFVYHDWVLKAINNEISEKEVGTLTEGLKRYQEDLMLLANEAASPRYFTPFEFKSRPTVRSIIERWERDGRVITS